MVLLTLSLIISSQESLQWRITPSGDFKLAACAKALEKASVFDLSESEKINVELTESRGIGLLFFLKKLYKVQDPPSALPRDLSSLFPAICLLFLSSL
ncbi:hypothetical protein KPH14_002625 [Odynerus spinipes]|uniref:Uncharacterized protein n=1 Tax=Odynerus spinipes TaxID=1348599 RepID=A0AAD9REM9_9HYME|nr:hypothetical protein KPH14_002625 [Odynerus spinipes]